MQENKILKTEAEDPVESKLPGKLANCSVSCWENQWLKLPSMLAACKRVHHCKLSLLSWFRQAEGTSLRTDYGERPDALTSWGCVVNLIQCSPSKSLLLPEPNQHAVDMSFPHLKTLQIPTSAIRVPPWFTLSDSRVPLTSILMCQKLKWILCDTRRGGTDGFMAKPTFPLFSWERKETVFVHLECLVVVCYIHKGCQA